MILEKGTPLPEWRLDVVAPAAMKVYAAITRDPSPIHWDRREVAKRGLGDRLVNQGPLNLGYVINMLHQWAGPESLRSLQIRFCAPVHEGDAVTAGGVVTSVRWEQTGWLVDCDVWLVRDDGTRAVTGTATVAWNEADERRAP